MDLIWGHISPKPMRCPELKNIGLTLWAIRKTSFLFSGHVPGFRPSGLVWPGLAWSGLVWSGLVCWAKKMPQATCLGQENQGVFIDTHMGKMFIVN